MERQLTILSYNIHKGFTSRNRKFVLSQIREAIRAVGADLVFLQEVIGVHRAHARRVESWPSEEQFEYLADTIWPHFAYGKNAVYDEGHHGNAILSKFPIIKSDNFDVSAGPHEQRGVMHCRVQIPEKDEVVECYCTHLGLFKQLRTWQFHKVSENIRSTAKKEAPIILAGDFNDWNRSACGIFAEQLGMLDAHQATTRRLARTFPSFFPLLHLDRIYTWGVRVEQAKVLKGRPWKSLSDHVPLLVTVSLPQK